MQTFLPYSDFNESAKCLDFRRLGKQRVEAFQILKALADPHYGWQNHPAVMMWRGYDEALRRYMAVMINEWISRGFKNTMMVPPTMESPPLPHFIGDHSFHLSHQSNLLRKDPAHYKHFFPDVPLNLPYIWPTHHD